MKRWILLLLLATGCATQRGFPPTAQIVNFDWVNASLYRGGQPNAAAIQWLRGQGIKTILNLRMADDVWPGEAQAAAACSIFYTNLPLHGTFAPTQAEMEKVLATIQAAPQPVFVHCQHGCDRTGTVVACYRIRVEHWGNRMAEAEADIYGLSWMEFGMHHFIASFR